MKTLTSVVILTSMLVTASACKPQTVSSSVEQLSFSMADCPVGLIRKRYDELADTWMNNNLIQKVWPFRAPADKLCQVSYDSFRNIDVDALRLESDYNAFDYTSVNLPDGFVNKCIDSALETFSKSYVPDAFDKGGTKVKYPPYYHYKSLSSSEKQRFKRALVSDVFYIKKVLQNMAQSYLELATGAQLMMGRLPDGVKSTKGKYKETQIPGLANWANGLDTNCAAKPKAYMTLMAQSEMSIMGIAANKIRLARYEQQWFGKKRNPSEENAYKEYIALRHAEIERYKNDAPWLNVPPFSTDYMQIFGFTDAADAYNENAPGKSPKYIPKNTWNWPFDSNGKRVANRKLEFSSFPVDSIPMASGLLEKNILAMIKPVLTSQEFLGRVFDYLEGLHKAYLAKLDKTLKASSCLYAPSIDAVKDFFPACPYQKEFYEVLAEIDNYPLDFADTIGKVVNIADFKEFRKRIQSNKSLVYNSEHVEETKKSLAKFQSMFPILDKYKRNLNELAESQRLSAADKKMILQENELNFQAMRRFAFLDAEYFGAACRTKQSVLDHQAQETRNVIVGTFVLGVSAGVVGIIANEARVALTANRLLAASRAKELAQVNTLFARASLPTIGQVAFQTALEGDFAAAAYQSALKLSQYSKLGASINAGWLGTDLTKIYLECEKMANSLSISEKNMFSAIYRPINMSAPTCLHQDGTISESSKVMGPLQSRVASANPFDGAFGCKMGVGFMVGLGMLGIKSDVDNIVKSTTYIKNYVKLR